MKSLDIRTLSSSENSNLLEIRFRQNRKIIPISGNLVLLEPSPFSIIFKHKGRLSLLINAWNTDVTFNEVINNSPFEELTGFYHTGMAEGLNNDDLAVTLSYDAPGAWFYRDKKDNRFDINSITGTGIKSIRTISNVRVVPENRQGPTLETTMESLPFDDIYLVITEYEYGAGRYENFFVIPIHLQFQ